MRRAVVLALLLGFSKPLGAVAEPEACAARQQIAIEAFHEEIQRVAGRPEAAKTFAPRLKALERRLETVLERKLRER